MNHTQAAQDVRSLFDWRQSAIDASKQPRDRKLADVGNGDLELALQLLACNCRDREMFGRQAPEASSPV